MPMMIEVWHQAIGQAEKTGAKHYVLVHLDDQRLFAEFDQGLDGEADRHRADNAARCCTRPGVSRNCATC